MLAARQNLLHLGFEGYQNNHQNRERGNCEECYLQVRGLALGCGSVRLTPGHEGAGLGVAVEQIEELGREVGELDLVLVAKLLDVGDLLLLRGLDGDG